MEPLKILVKFPSRGRPERFFKSLDTVVENMQDTDNYHVSCTLDLDDETMNNSEVIKRIATYKHVSICWGYSTSKVDAVNRSLPSYGDIILVTSDDMQITFYGFDTIIRQAFNERGLDTLLHIPDNDAKAILATMYIAGRTFYDRFKYIYNPIYSSLFCDNEIQELAKHHKCYFYLDVPGLIFHSNPAYGHLNRDTLFDTQQEIGWTKDQATFLERQAKNFDL